MSAQNISPEAFQFVAIADVAESPKNPRRRFDEARLAELTASVKEKGVLVPLLVRPAPSERADCAFEVLAGARRLRAARAAGHDHVPVIVRELDDAQALEVMVIENLQRADVHPLDEAHGYRALLELDGYDVAGVAARVGKSESYVYQRLKLLELVPAAQELFLEDYITAAHAILLARLQPKDQTRAIEEALADEGWFGRTQKGERRPAGTAKALAQWIEDEVYLDLKKAPWRMDDAALHAAAGSCTDCSKRTGYAPALFPEIKSKDTCTDPACFQAKRDAWIAFRKNELYDPAKKAEAIEIRQHHRHGKGERGLNPDQWRKAKRECAAPKMAVVVDGEAFGASMKVCVEKACKQHGAGEQGHVTVRSDNPARTEHKRREERARLEERVRVAVLDAIVAKVPAKLGRPELEMIVLGYFDDVWADFRKKLLHRWFGPPADKKAPGARDYTRELRERLSEIPDDLVSKMLIELAFCHLLHVSPYDQRRMGEMAPVAAAAKRYGLDPKRIRERVEREAKAAVAAKKGRRKKTSGKPVSKGKKKRRAA